MRDDLQNFVRDSLSRGLSRDAIRDQLLRAGWRPEEVDAALHAYAESDFPVPVPRRRPYLSARDAFLYLVLFATLYTTAFNVGQVLYVLLDRWLPDPLQREAGSYSLERIRGATAALVIAFPVFLLMSRIIGRDMAKEPEKRGSPIRKWLTYLTLFIAALILLGDLTVLVTRALGGDLTPRFLLKVAVVFAIAGFVFGHYLGDLRQEEQGKKGLVPRTSLAARLAATAVAVVIAAGFFVSGSPFRERMARLDRQRVEDLREIARSVSLYYENNRVLPDSLGALLMTQGTYEGRLSIRDPITHAPYEYARLDSTGYELCATFEAPSDNRSARPFEQTSEFWKHSAGRQCFRLQAGRSAWIPPP